MTLDEIVASGKPYFGDFLVADQGHNYFEHFTKVYARVRGYSLPLRILEVGSWAGASLVAWDKACESNVQFTVVDIWEPGPHAVMGADIRRLFSHNVLSSGLDGRVIVREGDSRAILPQLKALPHAFDIVFVDGCHKYEFAHTDIRNAMDLVRVGGIVCGDDLQLTVQELHDRGVGVLSQLDKEFIPEHGGYHPGVTQAVYDHFGDAVSRLGRFWAMQKTPTTWESL